MDGTKSRRGRTSNRLSRRVSGVGRVRPSSGAQRSLCSWATPPRLSQLWIQSVSWHELPCVRLCVKKRPTLGSSGRADARCSPGPKGAANAAIETAAGYSMATTIRFRDRNLWFNPDAAVAHSPQWKARLPAVLAPAWHCTLVKIRSECIKFCNRMSQWRSLGDCNQQATFIEPTRR
jgi:hypothetical protein